MARGSRGGGEAAGGRHHVAEGLLQQGAGAGGAGPGAGQRLQYNMLSRLSGYTVHSTSASWPSRGWPGCRVCGCVRASRASWTAATRGRGRTCPGSWGRCRRAAEVARVSRGGDVYRRQSPGMRASCAGSEADWRSFSSCVRWSVAWNIILEF